MGYIYCITNKLNNKQYIGETAQKDVETRWRGHKYSFNKGNGCPVLQNAVKQDGIENFEFKVLIICFDEDRFIYEKEYIKKYNTLVPNGYNVLEGGEAGGMFRGHQHTEETKMKMSVSIKKYYENEENRKRHGQFVSEALKTSEKWKMAIAEGRLGSTKPKSEVAKNNISKSVSEYWNSKSESEKMSKRESHSIIMSKSIGKKIKQYTHENIFIKEYETVTLAAKETDIGRRNIQNVLSGKTKTAGGFIWKYAEKFPA